VNLRYLKLFQQEHQINDTMRTFEVVNQIIIPATAANQVSFTNMLANDQQTKASFLGDANCMISHAWACSFMDTLRAIEAHILEQQDPDSYFVLLDILYINQHAFQHVHDVQATYNSTLRQLTNMVTTPTDKLLVLCIDNWEDAVMLKRAWWVQYAGAQRKFPEVTVLH
jgi:hypothetical protein